MREFSFRTVATMVLILVSSSFASRENDPQQTVLGKDDTVINDIHILLFESDTALLEDQGSSLAFFRDSAKKAGIKTTIYGEGSTYKGFGDKYVHLRPLLSEMNPDELIILSDSRDVLLNVPDKEHASEAIQSFKNAYQRMTKGFPDAVVVSAEAQCCVSALSHASPQDYFDSTGQRNMRACSSGEPDCLYEHNGNIFKWKSFMKGLAVRMTESTPESVYLNAGLIVGYPQNILHLLDRIRIEGTEDDQAVLSGLLFHDPSSIVLDYWQELFGNNQWPDELEEGCVYDANQEKVLVHRSTKTKPLIVHTSGKFFDCLDRLVSEVGGVMGTAMSSSAKTDLEMAQGRNLQNYGVRNYGLVDSDDYGRGRKLDNYGLVDSDDYGRGRKLDNYGLGDSGDYDRKLSRQAKNLKTRTHGRNLDNYGLGASGDYDRKLSRQTKNLKTRAHGRNLDNYGLGASGDYDRKLLSQAEDLETQAHRLRRNI